jgi:hypothetical protein
VQGLQTLRFSRQHDEQLACIVAPAPNKLRTDLVVRSLAVQSVECATAARQQHRQAASLAQHCHARLDGGSGTHFGFLCLRAQRLHTNRGRMRRTQFRPGMQPSSLRRFSHNKRKVPVRVCVRAAQLLPPLAHLRHCLLPACAPRLLKADKARAPSHATQTLQQVPPITLYHLSLTGRRPKIVARISSGTASMWAGFMLPQVSFSKSVYCDDNADSRLLK